MNMIQLAERSATVLWQGDCVVLGDGLPALATARSLAMKGLSIALLVPGPTLGAELSLEWQTVFPDVPLLESIRRKVNERCVSPRDRIDIVLGTIACDLLAEEAGVSVFLRVQPTRPLADSDGCLTGVEVVGKSGRQAVLASRVIDATRGRVFSRSFLGLPARGFRQIRRSAYVHGLGDMPLPMQVPLQPELGVVNNVLDFAPAAWPGEAIVSVTLSATPSTPEANRLADSLRTLTGAVTALRQDPVFGSLALVEVAPDAALLFSEVPGQEYWAELADTGLEVLKEGADLAAEFEEAEGLAARIVPDMPGRPLPVSDSSGCETVLATSELAASEDQDLAECVLPPACACLHAPADVVVAGYGTGGAVAALTAAEKGLSVCVLDPAALPGGIGTAGRIHSYYHGLKGGMQDRLDETMTGAGKALAPAVQGYHPVAKADLLFSELTGKVHHVFSGHTVFAVVVDEGRVTGVVSAAPDGYHVFPCLVAIDATGDGDLAAAAGAPMQFGRDGDGFPQPYSYTPTLMRKGQLAHHNFDAGWVDPTDTLDLSRVHLEGRRRIWDWAPYSDERHYCSLACLIGIRESRFVRGSVVIHFEDFLEGRTYPDSVCSSFAHHDNHAMDYAEESGWSRHHVVMFGLWRYLCHGDIPYRALQPQGVDGLLMACRALSVDHDLHQLVRMQRDIQVFGEICGIAAAMAIQSGSSVADVDLAELKAELVRRGIEPKPTVPQASGSVPELLEALASDNSDTRGLALWRFAKKQSDPAPDWEQVLASEPDAVVRFIKALAAVFSGADSPSAFGLLREVIRERIADPRLGVKSPPRYVVAALALAERHSEGAAEIIGDLLLTGNPAAPEVLLLLAALADLGDAAGVAPVRKFLAANDDNLFCIPLWGVSDGFRASFRPAVEIRAVRTLGRLGCSAENGRLDAYLDDASLLVRRHARRVAREIGYC